MNKLLRALMVLGSLALTSALFGASVNLGSLNSGNVVQTTVEGSYDGSIRIINSDTNVEVASVSFFKNFYGGNGGWWYAGFSGYGWSDVGGVVVTVTGQTAEISGLPAGNYRIEYSSDTYPLAEATVNGTFDWSQPTVSFVPVGTPYWDWLDFYTSIY